jgi:hypothetical protein
MVTPPPQALPTLSLLCLQSTFFWPPFSGHLKYVTQSVSNHFSPDELEKWACWQRYHWDRQELPWLCGTVKVDSRERTMPAVCSDSASLFLVLTLVNTRWLARLHLFKPVMLNQLRFPPHTRSWCHLLNASNKPGHYVGVGVAYVLELACDSIAFS